ncbi:MAG: hypothetical protein HGB15_07450 [Chlorobaculum sp.]|nr:hypothetical protein [Chlorobaculum sp.]
MKGSTAETGNTSRIYEKLGEIAGYAMGLLWRMAKLQAKSGHLKNPKAVFIDKIVV